MGTTTSAPLNADVIRPPPGHIQSALPPERIGNAPSTLQSSASNDDRTNRPDAELTTFEIARHGIGNSDNRNCEDDSISGAASVAYDGSVPEEHLAVGDSNGTQNICNGGHAYKQGRGFLVPSGSHVPQNILSAKRPRDGGGAGAAADTPRAGFEAAEGESPVNLGPYEGPLRKRRTRELREAEAAEAEARAAALGRGGLTSEGAFRHSFAAAAAEPAALMSADTLPATMPGMMPALGGSNSTLGDVAASRVMTDNAHHGGGHVVGHEFVVAGGGGVRRGEHGSNFDYGSFSHFPTTARAVSSEEVDGGIFRAPNGNASVPIGRSAAVGDAAPGSGAEMVTDGTMCVAASSGATLSASITASVANSAFTTSSAAVGIAPPPFPSSAASKAMVSNDNATGVVSSGSAPMQMPMSAADFISGHFSSFVSSPSSGVSYSYEPPAGSDGLAMSPSAGGGGGGGMFSPSYSPLYMPSHSSLCSKSSGAGMTAEEEAATAAVNAAANVAFAAINRSVCLDGGSTGGFPTMNSVPTMTPSGAGGIPPDYEGAFGGGGKEGALAPLAAIFLGSHPPPAMSFSGGAVNGSGSSRGRTSGHRRKRSGESGSGRQQDGGGETPRRNRSRPTCTAEGCQQRPLFGIEGTKQAIFCSQHKAPGMTNVLCRRCEVEGCKHQPSFAVEGSRAVRCATHKTPDMVNVAAPRCKSPGCMVCPSFGRQGERKASFCATHRREGDVDLVTRRCHHEGCVHRPVFGHSSEKKAFYCARHKLEGMVNVFAARCAFAGCTHQPSYGVPGSRRPTHCGKHRTQFHENKR